MPIDLHIHTTASDGTLTPRESVVEAAAKGISVLGVTDHDTLSGLPEAAEAGAEHGVEVIPGVEITTEIGRRREYHLLGYFVRTDDEQLKAGLKRMTDARLERGKEMVRRLKQLGLAITFDEVLEIAGGGALGRPHVARALHRRGHVARPQDAFNRWIGRDRPAYVPRFRLSPVEAVEMLLQSDAIPVLAHPGLSGSEAYIHHLAGVGLQGLEVYHPEHTPSMSRRFSTLAQSLGLLETGGSDSHGPGGTRPIEVGAIPVPDVLAERLKEAHAGKT